MRKLDKTEIASLTFITLCAINFAFGKSSPFWDSFYFIKEHGFIIALLLLIRSESLSSFSVLLKYSIIVYKLELILFNILLIFLNYHEYEKIKHCYNFVIVFTASIFLLLFIAKFFDKICLTLSRLKKWINK